MEHAAFMGELEGVADLQHDLHEPREAPLTIGTLLLSALMPMPQAFALAIVARLWITTAELLLTAIVFTVRRARR